ncbi:hypothetical protein J5N97_003741 [Dioscorea zingiberensis]|uniref:Uncharacterized protein n=1 Tax=Dioscorea zingiberensis TaxID=325984 RepID=A0A9D5D4P7_9LILI|nr:hypothetical protein J5N97_003741 [Dioscorea zingiberensis]
MVSLQPTFLVSRFPVVRLRSGSLWRRGVHSFKEFDIPIGLIVHPYVERIVFVYQNLGNWSSVYYPLPGFTYLAPLLGLLIYDAANLSAKNLPELDFVASKSPIMINFTNVAPVLNGLTPQCGHFSIVVNSTGLAPSPSPGGGPVPGLSPGPSPGPSKSHKSKVWKIVGGVAGGFVGLVLLGLLLVWLLIHRQNKKVAEMEHQADVGEALQMTRTKLANKADVLFIPLRLCFPGTTSKSSFQEVSIMPEARDKAVI